MNEMTEGYFDGIDANAPEPSDNRSYAYRHGFMNGRDDLNNKPRSTAAQLRLDAKKAEIADKECF